MTLTRPPPQKKRKPLPFSCQRSPAEQYGMIFFPLFVLLDRIFSSQSQLTDFVVDPTPDNPCARALEQEEFAAGLKAGAGVKLLDSRTVSIVRNLT